MGIIKSNTIPVDPNTPGPHTDHSKHTTVPLPAEPDQPYAREFLDRKPVGKAPMRPM